MKDKQLRKLLDAEKIIYSNTSGSFIASKACSIKWENERLQERCYQLGSQIDALLEHLDLEFIDSHEGPRYKLQKRKVGRASKAFGC